MSLQDAWRRSRLAGHSREIGAISAGLATLVVGSLALGSFVLKVNDLTPANAATIQPETDIDIHFFGLPYGARVHLDGHELPAQMSLTQQTLRCHVKGLPEGQHKLQVELFSPLKTAEAVSEFTVDSTPPPLTLESSRTPLMVARSRYAIHGQTERLATVTLGTQQVPADSAGRFTLDAELKPGWNDLVVRAKDLAGNTSERKFRVFNDSEAPQVELERVLPDPERKGEGVKLDGHVAENHKARLRLVARDDSGRVVSASWSIDGGPFKALPLKKPGGEPGPLTPYKAEWVVDNLFEGDRKVICRVSDKVGRMQNVTATFTVDSSEKLGERPLTRGARGADVEALQEKLVVLKHLEESASSGVYDEATEQAVEAYQEAQNYKVTGILDGETLQSLGPRIFVNLSLCSLVLDRPGQEQKRYGVADGASSFPTPTGRYKITYKEKHPTWMPPDSPWAKEAKAIPPGPGNPLGTRWIGLDSSSVGIHGTNADWSIGTHASHGCLRMHIPEVEQLYDMVEPGMPVIIYGGWEKNADIERYWPQPKAKAK